jgi:hypothetical protein
MFIPNVSLEIGQLRRDARNGRLLIEQLLDIIEDLQKTLRREKATNHRLTERLAQYEPEAKPEGTNPASATETPSASYSLDAETKRRQRRRRKKSPGRQPTEVKFADAERFQDVYPDGVRRRDCQRTRPL